MAVIENLELVALRLAGIASPLKVGGLLLLAAGVVGAFSGLKAAAFFAVLASFWLLGFYFFCQLLLPSVAESGAVIPLSSRVGASSSFSRLYVLVFIAVWFSLLGFMSVAFSQRVLG